MVRTNEAGGESPCDFCAKPDAEWRYPCDDHCTELVNSTIGEHGVPQDRAVSLGYEGAWAACTDCRNLYEEGGVEALSDRVAALYRMADPTLADPVLYEKVRMALIETYTQFTRHRTGSAVQIEKKEAK